MNRLEIKADFGVDDAGKIEGIAWPWGAPDTHGDTIVKGAFGTSVTDMPMLYGYNIIGLWDEIRETDRGLEVKVHLSLGESDRAKAVRSLIQSGMILIRHATLPPRDRPERSTFSSRGTPNDNTGGRGMKGVDTVARIRREFFVRGRTIKEIVRELQVSRNTVRKVLRSNETAFGYERSVQPMPKLGAWKLELDRILAVNESRSTRDRLTLIRIFEELRGSDMKAATMPSAGMPEAGSASRRRWWRPPMCR